VEIKYSCYLSSTKTRLFNFRSISARVKIEDKMRV